MKQGYVRLKTDRRGFDLLTPSEGGYTVFLLPREDICVKPGDLVEYEVKSKRKEILVSEDYFVLIPSRFDLAIKGKLGRPDFIYGSWNRKKGLFRKERFPWKQERQLFGHDYSISVSGQLDILLERIPEVGEVLIDDTFRFFGNCSFIEALADRRNLVARKMLRDILRGREIFR